MASWSRREILRLLALAPAAVLVRRAAAAPPPPLAIKGYDPVAYFVDGKPVLGRPDLEYEWDEHRYRFSRAENRALFRADPVRYAPQFANWCAMALTRGELEEADPRNWLIREGKLYIFGKPIGPDAFDRDLAANVGKANANRALAARR